MLRLALKIAAENVFHPSPGSLRSFGNGLDQSRRELKFTWILLFCFPLPLKLEVVDYYIETCSYVA